MIKLIVFDIDGVITDGTYTIHSNGQESKTISYKDLDSFNLIKSLNVKTMFLTSEKNALTKYFNEKFKPDIFYDGIENKFEVLNKYLINNKIELNDICYIGDGKKDIKCIESCGLSICPSNAIDEVKEQSKIVLNVSGGSGVIYEVYKIINNLNNNKVSEKIEIKELNDILNEHIRIIERIRNDYNITNNIDEATKVMINSIKNGGVIFSCGNGGSAADAQHFTAELIGRFKYNRKAIPAITLTPNSSIITSISNDYSFDQVFSRQIEGLGRKGDVLLAITTSGNSNNIKSAIKEAQKKEMKVVLLTSERHIEDNNEDVIIKIPSVETARIQEFHIMIIHNLCEKIEREYVTNEE